MRLFVNLATGPENPTRAALALLVARTAAETGHEVRVFLAGDAVQLTRAETAEAAHGIGSGSIAEHLQALTDAGVPIALSGLSSKTRGVDADTRAGIELAPPSRVVELADWAETTLVY